MAKKNRENLFFSGVAVLAASNILVKIIGFIYKIPLLRILGEEGMGYFNAAYNIYTMFYMVSTAGLPIALSILVSEARTKGNKNEVKVIYRTALLLFLAIGAVGTSFMLFGSKWLAKVIEIDQSYYCIMAIAPTLFFICICASVRGFFQGYQNMVPTALSEFLEALGKLGLGMLFGTFALKQGYPLPQVAAFAILGITVGVVLGTVYIVVHKILFKTDKYEEEFVTDDTLPVRGFKAIVKDLVYIAVPVTLSSSVMSIANFFDIGIIAGRLQSIGFTEQAATEAYGGYTSTCVPFFNLPPILIYPISAAVVPYISSALVQKNNELSKKITTQSFKIAALIAIPSAVGLSALSKPIINTVFGDYDTWGLLSVLAIAVFFLGMLSVSNAVLQANKLQKYPIISMVTGCIVKILSSYLLIGNEKIGIYGAPIGTVLCYLTIMILNFWFLSKKVGILPDFREVFFKPFAASVICAAAALGVYYFIPLFGVKIRTLLSIVVAVMVYAVFVFVFKAITKEDIMMIPKGEKIYSVFKKIKLMK